MIIPAEVFNYIWDKVKTNCGNNECSHCTRRVEGGGLCPRDVATTAAAPSIVRT